MKYESFPEKKSSRIATLIMAISFTIFVLCAAVCMHENHIGYPLGAASITAFLIGLLAMLIFAGSIITLLVLLIINVSKKQLYTPSEVSLSVSTAKVDDPFDESVPEGLIERIGPKKKNYALYFFLNWHSSRSMLSGLFMLGWFLTCAMVFALADESDVWFLALIGALFFYLLGCFILFFFPLIAKKNGEKVIGGYTDICEDRVQTSGRTVTVSGAADNKVSIPYSEVSRYYWHKDIFVACFYWNKRQVGIAINTANLNDASKDRLKRVFPPKK